MKKSVKYLVLLLAALILFINPANTLAAQKNSTSTVTPPAPTLAYSPSTPTNGNVTVTIYYPLSAVTKQYKLGTNGIWLTYTAPFAITSNTYICARYQNSSGVWSTLGGVNVLNIDKTPPPAPVFSPSSSAPTNQDVTVSVSFSTDSAVKQYKIGNSGIWANYTVPIISSINTDIYAKAADAAGNWSTTSVYAVANIDKVAPSVPILTANTTNPTNQDVNVTISYPSDANIKLYKTGASGTWIDYSGPVTTGENTAIYAKAQDTAGNWSEEGLLVVSNIDRTAPESPVISTSNENPTNQAITVTINYTSDSIEKKYKIGSTSDWIDYSSPFTVNTNSIIYAKASDNAGNWSQETNYVINNIDTVSPALPVLSASTNELTNQNVVISIDYSADSVIKQYKVGSSGLWSGYNSPITLSSNDTIYAKASDNAGNWTEEATYSVNNIDVTPPSAPVILASTTASTDQPVTMAIQYSEDSIIKQYKIGVNGSWLDYTVPVVLSANNTIYARGSDNAGNWSTEASCTITNIVKTVLGYTVKYWSTDVASYNSMVANTSTLNEIATATYTVDGVGTLTGTAPLDQINYANSNGIRPKLMVGNNFDAAIAKQLLESPQNRQNLKNNILNLLKIYNYKGVDIDIENIPASCRNYFTTFMSELYGTLHPLGYEVSVAVQAKTVDSPNISWTYAFDYQSLPMYSDYLMLMAYDEHYPGGIPGAVASIDWVTKAVEYALTVVPKEKLVLGLAAYGYDWSSGATKSYSINGCINLANQYGSTIYFDQTTKSKYFNYTVNGISHTVWFEDGDTIAHKLDLALAKDIKGVGIWRLGLENPHFWSTIKSKLNK